MRRVRVDSVHLAGDTGHGIVPALPFDGGVDSGGKADILGRLRRAAHRIGNAVQPRGHAVCAALGVVGRLRDQFIQLLELLLHLIHSAFRQLDGDIRLHLADNAAHVLAAAHAAFVDTAANLAAAPSGNAADIVADVLMADGGLIGAVGNRAGGIARDAAGIRRNIERIDPRQLSNIQREGQVDTAQVNCRIGAFDVDKLIVAAHVDPAEVVARDTAGHILAEQRAARRARADHALRTVFAGNATGIARAGHRSGEIASGDFAVVFSGDAADRFAFAVRADAALDIEVDNRRAHLHTGEQARRRGALRDAQVSDGVSAAVKCPAEGRHGRKFSLQRDIRRQLKAPVLRPCVQRAVCGKFQKLLRRGDRYNLNRLLRLLFLGNRILGFLRSGSRVVRIIRSLRENRKRQREQQCKRHQAREKSNPVFTLHHCPPPPRRQNRKLHSDQRRRQWSRAARRARYR